jgi:hypothetical protein
MDTIESSENDWYFYKVQNAEFTAAGDLSKLQFLLSKFRELVESNVKHLLMLKPQASACGFNISGYMSFLFLKSLITLKEKAPYQQCR